MQTLSRFLPRPYHMTTAVRIGRSSRSGGGAPDWRRRMTRTSALHSGVLILIHLSHRAPSTVSRSRMCPTSPTGSSSIRPSSQKRHTSRRSSDGSPGTTSTTLAAWTPGLQAVPPRGELEGIRLFLGPATRRFEDAAVADVNGDGRDDIVLGGWSNLDGHLGRESRGQGHGPLPDPPALVHQVHAVDSPIKVCAVDLDRDGRCDLITTSASTSRAPPRTRGPSSTSAGAGRAPAGADLLANGGRVPAVIALFSRMAEARSPGSRFPPVAATARPRGPGSRMSSTASWATGRNWYMTCMAFALSAMSTATAGRTSSPPARGEGPDPMDDPRQIGDGLAWLQHFRPVVFSLTGCSVWILIS